MPKNETADNCLGKTIKASDPADVNCDNKTKEINSMKKPKFLQRFLNKKEEQREQKFKIASLEQNLERTSNNLNRIIEIVANLEAEQNKKSIEKQKEVNEKTNPYKADKWKVVYDAEGKLSTVYLNGQELYGARCFSFDIDGTQEGLYKDVPILNYEGYGSIEVITESE